MNCPKLRHFIDMNNDMISISAVLYPNQPINYNGMNYSFNKLYDKNIIEGIRIALYPHQIHYFSF